MSYLFLLLLGVYGCFFTFFAIKKLRRDPHLVEELENMGIPYGFAYLAGGIEVICGPLMLAGIWLPLLAGVSAIVMTGVMLGAAVANGYGRDIQHGLGVAIIFVLPMIAISYWYWPPVMNVLGLT